MHSLNSTVQPNSTIQFKCAIEFNGEAPRIAQGSGAKRQRGGWFARGAALDWIVNRQIELKRRLVTKHSSVNVYI